jgi:membrane complex biogenesis BtpA family protein
MSDIINKIFGTTISPNQSKFGKTDKIVIGMVHLPPLPGSPGWAFEQNMMKLESRVNADVESLAKGGVSGIIFENYGDAPFSKSNVPALTISALTKMINQCTTGLKLPYGINVLRNDWEAALAIGSVTGASFIRINILSGVYATDQGLMEGDAYGCLRYRKALELELGKRILIFADVNTKHGTPLQNQSLEESTLDLVERAKVDGLIITGSRTGVQPTLEDVMTVSKTAGDVPLFVGSGVNENNINDFKDYVSGFIVGTCLKKDGKLANPVDGERVRKLMNKLKIENYY